MPGWCYVKFRNRVPQWRVSGTGCTKYRLVVSITAPLLHTAVSLMFGTRSACSVTSLEEKQASSQLWQMTIFCTSEPANRRPRKSLFEFVIKPTGHFIAKSLALVFEFDLFYLIDKTCFETASEVLWCCLDCFNSCPIEHSPGFCIKWQPHRKIYGTFWYYLVHTGEYSGILWKQH